MDDLPFYYNKEIRKFQLNFLDRFFKPYQPAAGGAKLLEFGGGAVVSFLISAALK